jgi:hypothetical protein
LDAFPQIAHLRRLRVLGIFHHGQAKQPKNAAPKAVVDTFLRSKLEFLSVNFKLPMDLAVQIVRACPVSEFFSKNLHKIGNRIVSEAGGIYTCGIMFPKHRRN